jgi:hypothetical protein
MLSAEIDTNISAHRLELFDGAGNPNNRFADAGSNTFDRDLHFAVTWNEATGEVKLYEQGIEVGSFISPILISDVRDVNNWLGRSQYAEDSNFQGEFDEFRLYDRVLTPEEVLGNFGAGADVVNTTEPSTLYVSGTSWSPSFRQFLADNGMGTADLGLRIPDGDPGLDELPWLNLNEISITAGDSIPVVQGDLVVSGVTVPRYAVTAFAYDPATRAATWTLQQPLANFPALRRTADRVTVRFRGDGLVQRLNVAPGDVTRDGSVSAQDYALARNGFGRSPADPGAAPRQYSAFRDINGTGTISTQDLGFIRGNLGGSLRGVPNPTTLTAATLAAPAIRAKSPITAALFSEESLLP